MPKIKMSPKFERLNATEKALKPVRRVMERVSRRFQKHGAKPGITPGVDKPVTDVFER